MRTSIKVLLASTLALYVYTSDVTKPYAKIGVSQLPAELEIFAQNVIYNHKYKGADINFIVDETPEGRFRAEAFAGTSVIYIGKGWLDESMRAFGDYKLVYFTLAHEIAHVTHRHVSFVGEDTHTEEGRNKERQADYTAIQSLYAVYEPCELVEMTLTILKNNSTGNADMPTTHPALGERIIDARYACSVINKTGKLPSDLYYEMPLLEWDYSGIIRTYNNVIEDIRNWVKGILT